MLCRFLEQVVTASAVTELRVVTLIQYWLEHAIRVNTYALPDSLQPKPTQQSSADISI